MRTTTIITAGHLVAGLMLLSPAAAQSPIAPLPAMTEEELLQKQAMAPRIEDLDLENFTATFSPVIKDPISNVAIGGYDPVSYFGNGGPAVGSETYTSEYQGAVFQFATAENRDAFEADPKRFAPRFGGYCVKNLAEGKILAGDPLHWAIDSDRLYFTFSEDAKVSFEKDRVNTRARASDSWSRILRPEP